MELVDQREIEKAQMKRVNEPLFLWFDPFQRLGQKYRNVFVQVLVQMKTSKRQVILKLTDLQQLTTEFSNGRGSGHSRLHTFIEVPYGQLIVVYIKVHRSHHCHSGKIKKNLQFLTQKWTFCAGQNATSSKYIDVKKS